jgi:YihY family inner membrane protein
MSALDARLIQLPLLDFVRLVARRIAQLRLAQTAASLASLSLLALVPVLSLGFWVLALSPSFGRLRDVFLKLIEQFMLPTVSTTVVKYLNQFATRGADLPIVGVLGFLVTAVIALSTVEKTIHLIWQVPNRRSWWRRLWLYAFILAGGPLLFATGFALTVGLGAPLVEFLIESLTNTRQERRELSSILNVVWPFILSCAALTWAYRMVPSVPVRWLAALLGGFVSTVLLSVLKIALTWYFTAFPSFKTVYGTLATLPILLLWLNAMWLVILIGAIVVASIEGFEEERIVRRWLPINIGSALVGKVMSAQELYSIALALRAELIASKELVASDDIEQDHWVQWKSLKSMKSLHPATARTLLEFLHTGQFVQIGRPPGSQFGKPLDATQSLLVRWNTLGKSISVADEVAASGENRGETSGEAGEEDSALHDYIWHGLMVSKNRS